MCRFLTLCLELPFTSYREKLTVLLMTDTSVSWVSRELNSQHPVCDSKERLRGTQEQGRQELLLLAWLLPASMICSPQAEMVISCFPSPSCTDVNCRLARSLCFPVNGRHVQSVMDNSMMSTTKSKRLAGCNCFFYSVKSFYVFSINIFILIGWRR